MSKARPVYLRRTRDGLVPDMRADEEALRRFPIGCRVKAASLTQPRSVPRNALYWSALAVVVDATGCVPTSAHLHGIIKLKLGFVTHAVLPTGEVVLIPDSTAFEEMDEAAFVEFADRAFAWLTATFGFDPVAQLKGAAA
jgi:hypothetical protein